MAYNPESVLTVQPIPTLSDEVNQIRLDTAEVVGKRIIPNEPLLAQRWNGNEEAQKLHADIVGEIKERSLSLLQAHHAFDMDHRATLRDIAEPCRERLFVNDDCP